MAGVTHRERLRTAARSLTLWLVAGAGLLAAVLVLIGLTLGVVRATIGEFFGWAAVLPGLVFAVGLALPAQFLLAVEARDGTGPRAAIRTFRDRWRRVLVADVAALGGAIGGGLGVAAVVLVGHTVVRYVEYAGGRVAPPSPWPVLYFLLAGGALGFWCVIVLSRDAAFLAAYEDQNPWTAWAGTLGAVTSRPRREAVYAALQTLTFGAGLVATLLTVTLGPRLLFLLGRGGADVAVPLVIAVTVALAVGTVGVAVGAAIHAAYFEGRVDPSVLPVADRWQASRVAVATVILVALVAGAGLVRTADLGAGGAAPVPLPADPVEARAVAIENTVTQDHRRVWTVESETDAGVESSLIYAVDFEDRRLRLTIHGDGEYSGGMFGEGIYATHLPVPADEPVAEDDWLRVHRVPGYGDAWGGGDWTEIDGPAWQLANETENRLVYRADDPDEVASLVPNGLAGTLDGPAEGSHAVLVVDREAGVVEFVRYRLRSGETGHARTYNASFDDVGSAEVRRPRSLGPREPSEWMWDLLYY